MNDICAFCFYINVDIALFLSYTYIIVNVNVNIRILKKRENMTGTVFDIKEFAVHDGPGVRQTVFLKGCPLRCQWCHNPEGLCSAPQLMFSRSSCIQCGRCMEVCPAAYATALPAADSSDQAKGSAHHISADSFFPGDACTACGKCVYVCPLGLRQISGKVMTSADLVNVIRENSDYYASLGGGVTFSGGEPLMQGRFLSEVLEQIPDIHTAIETSAYADHALFRQVISRLSFIMMDVKLMDPDQHKHYTGVDNAPILRNLNTLCEGNKPFIVRIPLIPGVNDSPENLEATARALSGAKALQRVEILPYHKTAGAKYGMLGMKYLPDFDTDRGLSFTEEIFEKHKIESRML